MYWDQNNFAGRGAPHRISYFTIGHKVYFWKYLSKVVTKNEPVARQGRDVFNLLIKLWVKYFMYDDVYVGRR